MALKRITPGISDTTVSTTLVRNYKDVDLKFSAKPGSVYGEDGKKRGDVYKKNDVKAIDQSVNNILLTNHYEKPFQPLFGADLTRLLFELNTEVSVSITRQLIKEQVEKYEPRVEVKDVEVFDAETDQMVPRGASTVFFYATSGSIDRYSLIIYVHCRIINTGQEVTIPVNMNRLR